MEQQSEPTAHASVSELALTPFSRLPPLNAFGLGTTENAALAVPGAASAPATATRAAARASSRDDIGSSCPSKALPPSHTQRTRRRFEGRGGRIRTQLPSAPCSS